MGRLGLLDCQSELAQLKTKFQDHLAQMVDGIVRPKWESDQQRAIVGSRERLSKDIKRVVGTLSRMHGFSDERPASLIGSK